MSRDNKHRCKHIYNGKLVSIREVCKEKGLNYNTISARIRCGWSIEKAIDTCNPGNPSWTIEEDDLLRQIGPTTHSDKLTKYFPRHTKEAILVRRKIFKISLSPTLIKKYQEERNVFASKARRILNWDISFGNLDKDCQQVLIGTIFGDGSISKYKNLNHASLKILHGYKQRDWLEWKENKLKWFKPNRSNWEDNKPRISTPIHPIFTELKDQFYIPEHPRKIKYPVELLKMAGDLGLLVWYMDDGTIDKRNQYPKLCTESMKDENYFAILKYLNDQYHMCLPIKRLKSKDIYLGAQGRDALIPIWRKLFIKHNMPKCMCYKLGI